MFIYFGLENVKHLTGSDSDNSDRDETSFIDQIRYISKLTDNHEDIKH